MRACPVCKIELIEMQLHGETIDRCPTCNGIHFDKGELENIIQLVRIHQEIILEEREIDSIHTQEKNRAFQCASDGFTMEKKEIMGHVIDICPECSGIWLDDGEIAILKTVENHIKKNIKLYIRLA